MFAKKNSNKLEIVRIYDAPVKMVWDAWTDLKQVGQWWGPRGFTITTHSKDLRKGGTWNYTMHGPDGTDYPNITTYHEVDQYKRLVYDHGASEGRPPLFRVTALFSEWQKNQTKLEMSMEFPSPEIAAEMVKFIKQAGGNGTWDRLAEFVEREKNRKEIFVINRSVKAPIELVFDMWTDPKHFASWMGPTGTEMEFFRSDIRTGGSTFYRMFNKQGLNMYGRAEYLEISRLNLLRYTQQFCDKDEKISRHPMAPTWPETMLTTVILSEEGPDQTRITVKWEVYGKATKEEMAAFIKERGGMTMGWTGTFDKLEEYLEGL